MSPKVRRNVNYAQKQQETQANPNAFARPQMTNAAGAGTKISDTKEPKLAPLENIALPSISDSQIKYIDRLIRVDLSLSHVKLIQNLDEKCQKKRNGLSVDLLRAYLHHQDSDFGFYGLTKDESLTKDDAKKLRHVLFKHFLAPLHLEEIEFLHSRTLARDLGIKTQRHDSLFSWCCVRIAGHLHRLVHCSLLEAFPEDMTVLSFNVRKFDVDDVEKTLKDPAKKINRYNAWMITATTLFIISLRNFFSHGSSNVKENKSFPLLKHLLKSPETNSDIEESRKGFKYFFETMFRCDVDDDKKVDDEKVDDDKTVRIDMSMTTSLDPLATTALCDLAFSCAKFIVDPSLMSARIPCPPIPQVSVFKVSDDDELVSVNAPKVALDPKTRNKIVFPVTTFQVSRAKDLLATSESSIELCRKNPFILPGTESETHVSECSSSHVRCVAIPTSSDRVKRLVPWSFFSSVHASVEWSKHASIEPWIFNSASTVKCHIKKQPAQTIDEIVFELPEDQFLLFPRVEKSIKVSFPSSFLSSDRVRLPLQQPLSVFRSDLEFTSKKTPDASAKKESESTVQLCDKHPIVFKGFPEDDDAMKTHLEDTSCTAPHLWCIAVVNDRNQTRLVPLSYLQDRNDFARPTIDDSLRSEKRIRELCQPFLRSNKCRYGTGCIHAHLTKEEFFNCCPILVDRLRLQLRDVSSQTSNSLLLNVLRSSMSTRFFDFVPSLSNGHIFGDMKSFWVMIADGLKNNNNNAILSDTFVKLEHALYVLEMGPHTIMEDFMSRFVAVIEHVVAGRHGGLEFVRDSPLLTTAFKNKLQDKSANPDTRRCEVCSRSHETHYRSLWKNAISALHLFLLETIYKLFVKWIADPKYKVFFVDNSNYLSNVFTKVKNSDTSDNTSFWKRMKAALEQSQSSEDLKFPPAEPPSKWLPLCKRIFPPDELENFFLSAFKTLKDKASNFNLDNLIKVTKLRVLLPTTTDSVQHDYFVTCFNIKAAFGEENYKTLVEQNVIANSSLPFEKEQIEKRLERQLQREECVLRTWFHRTHTTDGKPTNKDNPFRHHRWILFNGDVDEKLAEDFKKDEKLKTDSDADEKLIFDGDSLDQSFFTSKTKCISSADNSSAGKKSSYSLKTSTHDVEFATAAFPLMLSRRNHWFHVTSKQQEDVKNFALKSKFESWLKNNSSASSADKARKMIELAGMSLRWSAKFYKRVFHLLHFDIAHHLQREPNPSIRVRLFRRLLTPLKMMKNGENKPDEYYFLRSSPFVVSDQIQRPCFILVRDETIRDYIRKNPKLHDQLKNFIVKDEDSLLRYLAANMTEENKSTCDNDSNPSGTAISHRRALVVVLHKQEVKDDYLMELAGDTLMLMYVLVGEKNTPSIKNPPIKNSSSSKKVTIPTELVKFEKEACTIKSLVFWIRRYREENNNTAPSMSDLERQSWYTATKFSRQVLDAFFPNKHKPDESSKDEKQKPDVRWIQLNGCSYFRERCFAESEKRRSDKSLWFHREVFDRIFSEKTSETQLPDLLQNEILPFFNEIGTTKRVDELVQKYSKAERYWLHDRLLPACPSTIWRGSTLVSREEALNQMKTALLSYAKSNTNNNNYGQPWWDKFIEIPLQALFYRRIAQCGAAFDFEDFKSSMIELIKKTTTVKEEGKDAVHVALHDLLPGLCFVNVEMGHRDFHLCSSKVVFDNGSPRCLKHGDSCTYVHIMSKELQDLERKMKESRRKLRFFWTNRSKVFETHVQIGHLLIPRNLLQEGCIDPLTSVAHWCWNTTCSGAEHNCWKAHVDGTAAHSSLEERKKAISHLHDQNDTIKLLPHEQYVPVLVSPVSDDDDDKVSDSRVMISDRSPQEDDEEEDEEESELKSSSKFLYPFHALDFKFRRRLLEKIAKKNFDGTMPPLRISENDAKFFVWKMKCCSVY